MHVAPSFSQVNADLTSQDGVPGLDTRAVATTVDLREGQWLAIAGLLQDQQTGSHVRVPFVGDIPVAGTIFGNREVRREETESIVLVSPELPAYKQHLIDARIEAKRHGGYLQSEGYYIQGEHGFSR